MRSHFLRPDGVAAACAVAGAAALMNGNCSAQPFLAADYPTNSTYASGWAAGQNGGVGFGAWSMDNTSTNPVQTAIDRTSPFDPFGTAWTVYNPEGTAPSTGNSPGGFCTTDPLGTDVSRAGRSCPPLLPGQTFSTVIANPTTRTFYRGYTIRLVTGSDNTTYGNAGTQIAVGTFEYFTYGRWYTSAVSQTSLFDTNTASGMQLDVTMTTTNTYHLTMTPLSSPSLAFAEDGTLATNGPINWVEYEMYNTDSDFYPTLASCGPDPTDFYVKSMTVSPLLLGIEQSQSNIVLSWPAITPSPSLESATNLGPTAKWNPVTPAPAIVNGRDILTNPITGAQMFYRLQ